jgi:hypothetical protein
MNISADTLHAILERHDSDVQWCASYGEPGYDTPEHGIVFANWNNVPRFIGDWLEHHGFECEWSDEWVISNETNKAYRSEPDSYGWLRSYFMTKDGEIIGRDEVESGDEMDAYLEYLLNQPTRADTFRVDWEKHGFAKVNSDSYEAGLHPGQTDDPRAIFREARKAHPECDFLFAIDDAGQFDTSFSLWSRVKDYDESDSDA